jgi:hypothetical protein
VDVFVLVFAVVFIAGFVVRGIYRATSTWRCPECRTRISLKATRCSACGAVVATDP